MPYTDTEYVSPWPWDNKIERLSDECTVSIPTAERYNEAGELIEPATTKGVDIECTFEEEIEVPSGKLRWFEQPQDMVMFRMTKEPQSMSNFGQHRV